MGSPNTTWPVEAELYQFKNQIQTRAIWEFDRHFSALPCFINRGQQTHAHHLCGPWTPRLQQICSWRGPRTEDSWWHQRWWWRAEWPQPPPPLGDTAHGPQAPWCPTTASFWPPAASQSLISLYIREMTNFSFILSTNKDMCAHCASSIPAVITLICIFTDFWDKLSLFRLLYWSKTQKQWNYFFS